MVSDEAFQLMLAIRDKYGADVKDTGPASLKEICELAQLSENETRDILDELERLRFVKIDRVEYYEIIGCSILEAGQAFLDLQLQ